MKLKRLVLLVLTVLTGVVDAASNGEKNTPALLPSISGSDYINIKAQLDQLKAQNAKLQTNIARLEAEKAKLQEELADLQTQVTSDEDNSDNDDDGLRHAPDINQFDSGDDDADDQQLEPNTAPAASSKNSGRVQAITRRFEQQSIKGKDNDTDDDADDQELKSSTAPTAPSKSRRRVQAITKRFEQHNINGANSNDTDDDDDN